MEYKDIQTGEIVDAILFESKECDSEIIDFIKKVHFISRLTIFGEMPTIAMVVETTSDLWISLIVGDYLVNKNGLIFSLNRKEFEKRYSPVFVNFEIGEIE